MPRDVPVRAHGAGVVLAVHVSPGARRSALVGWHGGALKVAVAAPPVDGRANDELCRFLAGVFGVRRGDVEVVAGGSARAKRVAIAGVTLASATRCLELAGIDAPSG